MCIWIYISTNQSKEDVVKLYQCASVFNYCNKISGIIWVAGITHECPVICAQHTTCSTRFVKIIYRCWFLLTLISSNFRLTRLCKCCILVLEENISIKGGEEAKCGGYEKKITYLSNICTQTLSNHPCTQHTFMVNYFRNH